jgi:hypothetical protein
LVDQAKKTAKAADGSPDGWRNYLDIRTKSLIKKGEEVFGEVG